MGQEKLFSLAIKLCTADMLSGYISSDPVINDRNIIVEERVFYYVKMLKTLCDTEYLSMKNMSEINLAVSLVVGDICSGVVANNPILYDRDEKIIGAIKGYIAFLRRAIQNPTDLDTSSAASEEIHNFSVDNGFGERSTINDPNAVPCKIIERVIVKILPRRKGNARVRAMNKRR